jgi:acetyl-CoA carboxylase biotin carboxyl carrier protein
MDFKQIQELIRMVSKSELAEVKLEQENFKITIKNKTNDTVTVMPQSYMPQAMPMPIQSTNVVPAATPIAPTATAAAASSADASTAASTSNYIEFKSPMIGTFYRKPGPDKDVFVKVGDEVKTGDVVCVIEAMKLFNEIEFEGAGTIVKILVEDASPVEYDQPLFLIEPK